MQTHNPTYLGLPTVQFYKLEVKDSEHRKKLTYDYSKENPKRNNLFVRVFSALPTLTGACADPFSPIVVLLFGCLVVWLFGCLVLLLLFFAFVVCCCSEILFSFLSLHLPTFY